jgi:hypothetical protein
MNHHPHHHKLLRLSDRLEELFAEVSGCGGQEPLPHDLADEIASTAGEVMVELSHQRGDELVRDVIDDARKLREVARTLCPDTPLVSEAGRTLARNLEHVIRADRRAA